MSKNKRNTNGARRGNARTKRGQARHKLNVRARSKKGRRAQWDGRWRGVLKWGVAAAFVIVLLLGVRRAIDHFLYESPKFKVAAIDFHTDGALTRARVLEIAGVETGQNILRVDLEEVRERVMEKLPIVRDVEIIRDLPDRLELRVDERYPIAWLADIQRTAEPQKRREGLLLDAEGYVVPCERLEPHLIDLPIVFSDDFSAAKPGKRLDSKPVASALELVAESREAFSDSPVELLQLRVASSTTLLGKLNTGTEVTFSIDDPGRQMDNLRVVMAEATRRGTALLTANVAPKRNVAVRFAERSAQTPTRAELVAAAPRVPRAIAVENAAPAPAAAPGEPPGEPRRVVRKRVLRSVPAGGAGNDRALRSILRVD